MAAEKDLVVGRGVSTLMLPGEVGVVEAVEKLEDVRGVEDDEEDAVGCSALDAWSDSFECELENTPSEDPVGVKNSGEESGL